MMIRAFLILTLLLSQSLPIAAATAASLCSDNAAAAIDDPTSLHAAACDEACCCPPDDCPCLSAPVDNPTPLQAPIPTQTRIDTTRIDLILSECYRVARGVEFTACVLHVPHADAPLRAVHNSIHSLIGVWLT